MKNQSYLQLQERIKQYQQVAQLLLLIVSDEEGGTVSRLSYNKIITPAFTSPQML